jgi:hypothetical protein
MSDPLIPNEMAVQLHVQDMVDRQAAKERSAELAYGDDSEVIFGAGTLKEVLSRPAGPAARVNELNPRQLFDRRRGPAQGGQVWFPPNRRGFPYAASRSGAAVFS